MEVDFLDGALLSCSFSINPHFMDECLLGAWHLIVVYINHSGLLVDFDVVGPFYWASRVDWVHWTTPELPSVD